MKKVKTFRDLKVGDPVLGYSKHGEPVLYLVSSVVDVLVNLQEVLGTLRLAFYLPPSYHVYDLTEYGSLWANPEEGFRALYERIDELSEKAQLRLLGLIEVYENIQGTKDRR